MTPDNPFPPLPPPALTRDHLLGVLLAAKAQGWDVFADREGFVVQTSDTTRMRLEVVNGVCRIAFKNTQGNNAMGISVETPLQVARQFHTKGWIYEEKIDGWRLVAIKDSGQVRLVSRNARDHTKRFRDLVAALTALKPDTFTLDAVGARVAG